MPTPVGCSSIFHQEDPWAGPSPFPPPGVATVRSQSSLQPRRGQLPCLCLASLPFTRYLTPETLREPGAQSGPFTAEGQILAGLELGEQVQIPGVPPTHSLYDPGWVTCPL